MNRRRALSVLLLAAVLGGCAGSASSGSSPSPPPTRVRCLTDPNEVNTRPLILLFCIQSP